MTFESTKLSKPSTVCSSLFGLKSPLSFLMELMEDNEADIDVTDSILVLRIGICLGLRICISFVGNSEALSKMRFEDLIKETDVPYMTAMRSRVSPSSTTCDSVFGNGTVA